MIEPLVFEVLKVVVIVTMTWIEARWAEEWMVLCIGFKTALCSQCDVMAAAVVSGVGNVFTLLFTYLTAYAFGLHCHRIP